MERDFDRHLRKKRQALDLLLNANRSLVAKYGFAVLISFVGIGVLILLKPLFTDTAPPLVTLTLSVAVAAWWGGLGAGMLATLICVVMAWGILVPPPGFSPPNTAEQVRIMFTGISGMLISVIAWRMHQTLGSLRGVARRLGDELDERRRVEEALTEQSHQLRESEQRLRAIFDFAALGIVEINRESRVINANPRFLQFLGYRMDELQGRTLHELTAPEDRERSIHFNERIQQGGPAIDDYEKRYLRKDGSRIWVHVTVSFIRDADGRFVRAVGTVEDISTRKRVEEERERLLDELAAEQARWKSIVEAIVDEVWICDREGRISLINLPEITHLSLNKFESLPMEQVMEKVDVFTLDGKPRSPEQAPLLRSLRGEVVRGVEIMRDRRTGRSRHRQYSAAPTRDPSGAITGAVTLVRDVTEQYEALQAVQQAREDLARSNRDLEQFANVVSHDLQEPLRMVTSFGQLLVSGYRNQLPEQARQYMEFMIEGASRMSDLIRGLLDYSRIESKKEEMGVVGTDLIVKNVLSNLKIAIESGHATIELSHLPKVYGNPTQLHQLFQNLIANALKYCKPDVPPRISICADRQGPDWFFSVTDNGIGIDPHYFDRIFVMFQRLHTPEEYSGVGIGLAICKKIAERHGGRIWVDSTPGVGTTFYFTLPVLQESEPAPEERKRELAGFP